LSSANAWRKLALYSTASSGVTPGARYAESSSFFKRASAAGGRVVSGRSPEARVRPARPFVAP
jgi:hypothetical protein